MSGVSSPLSLRGGSILLLGLAACSARERPAASTADSTPLPPAAAPAGTLATPDGGFDIAFPDRWRGHYLVDSLSTQERGRALSGSVVFLYQPSDSTLRPEALLAIAVYDSAAWRAVRADGGPPPGDSVAARGGHVYVLGQPQSNPFAPNTADAILFQLLTLRPQELRAVLRPR